ncbi:MAG: hypothetical protein DCF31_14830 [Alphaproteobacteria bacterium]|nr:MAG: hypothetical protein DCF31_14830 [Alphaproteobacteria bacterium]
MFGKWDSTSRKINGKSVNIAHTKLSGPLSDSAIGNAGAVVDASRTMLQTAISATSADNWSDAAKAAAAKLFLTDASGPSDAERKAINKVLRMTKDGLGGTATIKVGSSADANGYVNLHKDWKHKIFLSNKVKSLGSGKNEYVGRQHVDRSYFEDFNAENRTRAILTYIHESTHRYAGTVDFDDQGYVSATTYIGNGSIRFREPGISKAQALVNADSYAVFVCEIA